MTLTLDYPTSGRIGPGNLWSITSDHSGAIVSGTTIRVVIRDTTSHIDRIGMSGLVSGLSMSGIFGVPQNYYTLIGGGVGLPDDDPVEIRAHWLVPGTGIVDAISFTGFQWDAVSQLAYANYLNMGYLSGIGSVASAKLDDILASVRHTYVTP